MQKTQVANLVTAIIISCVFGAAIGKGAGARNRDYQEPQEASYTLTQLPENSLMYSLVISDVEERSISGSFSIERLRILKNIMVSAMKFAMTEEASGTKEPITTRFADKQEAAFAVDVQKVGTQSLLFFTLKTEIGQITWTAGRTNRSTKREDGFFFGLLARLDSELSKVSDRPSK